LSSHRFASSIDGSLAPCFNSMLLGDTMVAVWVQKIARWDGFSSSQFGQINSTKRKTLGTSFSLFKLPLKFSDRRRKSKRSKSGKTGANLHRGPPGRIGLGRPAHPAPGAGMVWFRVYRPFFAFSAHGQKLA
jgi:hypothetical protein